MSSRRAIKKDQRDGDGHGSHTAGTAAGNHLVDATVAGIDFGQISGVAPGAKIAAYKVCWNGKDAASTADDGCATSDLLAGIEAATADGVDVINYSIGGGAADSTVSIIDQAFLGAAAAGIDEHLPSAASVCRLDAMVR